MGRLGVIRAMGLGVALTLVTAACGSSSDSGTATNPTGTTAETETTDAAPANTDGGPSVRGVTATEIKIQGIAPLTSAGGGYPGADIGAMARFARVNDEGGINGRTINYLGTADDTEDGSKNLDLVKKAVQQDEVFAVVPMLGAGFLPASSDFLNENKVPSVGWGFMPGQCAGLDSYGFGFNGCIQPPGVKVINGSLAAPIMEILGEGSAVAIVSDDSANSTDGLKTVKLSFIAAGANVVYAKPNVPTTANVDYTPFVQDVMQSNDGKAPDLVVFNSLFANTVGITAGLRAAGYTGAVLNFITYVPGLLESSPDLATALDGSYVLTQFLPTEFGGPAIEQMKKDVEAVSPGTMITLAVALTYWMADVFVQMLEAVGPDLTPETFGKVINGGFTYQPDGEPMGIGPVAYPDDHVQPSPCAALVQIKGTKYEPVSPMKCYTNIPADQISVP